MKKSNTGNAKIPGSFNRLLKKVLSIEAWSYDAGLLILRFSCALMVLHGWSKFDSFEDGISDWPDPFHIGPVLSKGLTVAAELFCSILILFGLFTRIALVPLVICMVTIVFVIHGEDPFEDKEHALLYLLPYLTLMLTGPGRYSIDSLIGSKRK